MRRWSFNILAALSLTLCLSFAVLWIRSATVDEQIFMSGSGGPCVWLRSLRGVPTARGGRLFVIVGSRWPSWRGAPFYSASRSSWDELPGIWDAVEGDVRKLWWPRKSGGFPAPFHSARGHGVVVFGTDGVALSRRAADHLGAPFWSDPSAQNLVPFREFDFPHWVAVAMFGLTPMSWLLVRMRQAVRRRHRHRAGLCLRCGYDLRASKERCPECGEPIPESRVEGTA